MRVNCTYVSITGSGSELQPEFTMNVKLQDFQSLLVFMTDSKQRSM